MFEAIVQGIGLGLLLCVLVGPVFFALMGIAIHYSKREAILFSIGTLVADLMYALLVYYGIEHILHIQGESPRMGAIGGGVFIIIGIMMIRKSLLHKKSEPAEIDLTKKSHPLAFVTQGFLTNALNPSVAFFWASVVAAASAGLGNRSYALVLIISAVATIFCTDILKVFLAEKLKRIMRGKQLYYIQIGSGSLLIVLGIFIIIKYFI